jgi:hypothetical protein
MAKNINVIACNKIMHYIIMRRKYFTVNDEQCLKLKKKSER